MSENSGHQQCLSDSSSRHCGYLYHMQSIPLLGRRFTKTLNCQPYGTITGTHIAVFESVNKSPENCKISL